MTTDPIADFITTLRNAGAVHKASVTVPFSNLKKAIAEKLKQEGYVGAIEKQQQGGHDVLVVELAYDKEGAHAIAGIERVSKPGRRLYAKSTELPRVMQGVGRLIISTPRGILTDVEARKEKVGGETLIKVW